MKLRIMKSLGGFKGLTYLDISLKQISLAKEIFLLNVAQGSSIYLPYELSQRNIAFSFRFYDPLLYII